MHQLLKLILITLIFASCRYSSSDTIEPTGRGIPSDAFWIDDADAGNWYQVVYVHDHRNNAYIKIFDNNGGLVVSKKFILVCSTAFNPIWIEDLKSQIIGFDGEKIYLKQIKGKDQCWLQ